MMGKQSIKNLREEEALASLLFDSENANQLYLQANPQEQWHTQDFIIRKPSSHRNPTRETVKKKLSPSHNFHSSLSAPATRNMKLAVSPRYQTRSIKNTSSSQKIKIKILGVHQNEPKHDSFCIHEVKPPAMPKIKKFQFVKQRIQAISVILGKQWAGEGEGRKLVTQKQPVSYSRYLKQRVHKIKLSQKLACTQVKFE